MTVLNLDLEKRKERSCQEYEIICSPIINYYGSFYQIKSEIFSDKRQCYFAFVSYCLKLYKIKS